MDFLNPLVAQMRELFASMTPGARVTAALLLAVVAVSLGFLFQRATIGPDEYLFGGDPIGRERLPRMEAAMSAAGVQYEVESNRIKVAQADKNAAIAAIADAGELPPEFHSLMERAMDGGGMFEFRELKLQRLRAAREAQASLILGEFPWVERANVIHNVREESGLRAGRHATAAVSVMPAPGERLTPARMRTVKDFVSKACDVPVEDVAVTNLGGDLAGADGGITPEDFDHPRYKLKALQEERIRDSILDQLAYIPGVLVQVNATIDDVAEQRVTETKPEGEAIPLRQSSNNVTDSQTVGVVGDRVGVEANGPNGLPRDDAPARQDQSNKKTTQKESSLAVGTRQTETVTSGYALREADASVAVPISYVEAVYRRENLDANGAEPDKIDPAKFDTVRSAVLTQVEEMVQPLLPRLSLGENKYRQVNVRFFRDLPAAAIPEPSAVAGALGWFGTHSQTLLMAGLALVSLVMLRSIASGGGKDKTVHGLPSLQLDGETLPDSRGGQGDDDEPSRPKLRLRRADTLKDDLSEMVSSDPDAAAAILRSWINNAA